MKATLKRIWADALMAGVTAIKDNWPALLAIQSLLVALLACYFWVPSMLPTFDKIMAVKARFGIVFTIVLVAFAGGVLSECFKVAAIQSGRWTRANWDDMVFRCILFGFMAIPLEYFYKLQNHLFGVGPSSVIPKVLLDQLLYSPCFAVPVITFWMLWKNQGCKFGPVWAEFRHFPSFYAARCAPLLLVNWCFWFPSTSVIYAMPPLLQIPVCIVASALWSLLLTSIAKSTKAHKHASSHPPAACPASPQP